jgi:hypothetical protein
MRVPARSIRARKLGLLLIATVFRASDNAEHIIAHPKKAAVGALIAASLALNSYLAWDHFFGPPTARMSNDSKDVVVMRTRGGLLEVSTITAEERFDSATDNTILGIPVGKTIAQVRVPSVYRYHIPLGKDWSIRVVGNTLLVVAPAVRPSLPVAVDTGKLQAFSSGLWAPFTGTAAIASLQKSITAALAQKAASAQFLLLQREAARTTVAEFVQKWVVDQPRWKNAPPASVLVFFEDEELGRKARPLLSQSL